MIRISLALCLCWLSVAAAQGQTPEPNANEKPAPPPASNSAVYAPRSSVAAVPGSPIWVYGGYPITYGATVYPGYYWPYPVRASDMPGSPMQPPANALPAQRSPWANLPAPKANPAARPVTVSTAAARAKALDYVAEGDQHVRAQKWQLAYASYRQAVHFADDLPEAHLRYGIVFAVLNRYDRAEMEFRRAVYIDPSLPTSAFTLESLFGPDSRLWRASILARLADWVEQDVADPQRLFVLGVMLHFNQDERAQDLFSAAARMTKNAAHVTAFLAKTPVQSKDAPPQPGLDLGVRLPPAPVPAAPKPQAAPFLPPAPEPARPGLGADPVFPALPKKAAPPKAVPPKAAPKESDGPVLLPPSPQ